MVKFWLPLSHFARNLTGPVTIRNAGKPQGPSGAFSIFKILIKFDLLAFESNLHRIRVDLAQNVFSFRTTGSSLSARFLFKTAGKAVGDNG
jgi:hypothetical protein